MVDERWTGLMIWCEKDRAMDFYLGTKSCCWSPWQKIIMGVCIQGLLGSLPSKNNHRSAAPRMWRCALFSVTQVTMSCKTAQASLLQPWCSACFSLLFDFKSPLDSCCQFSRAKRSSSSSFSFFLFTLVSKVSSLMSFHVLSIVVRRRLGGLAHPKLPAKALFMTLSFRAAAKLSYQWRQQHVDIRRPVSSTHFSPLSSQFKTGMNRAASRWWHGREMCRKHSFFGPG